MKTTIYGSNPAPNENVKSRPWHDADVVIVGAGPYGLAAATHLRTIKGLDVRIFGSPMSFWKQQMPIGMYLRSNWSATQIADPGHELTLDAYQAASGSRFSRPVPLEHFIEYGLWYQHQAVPDVDQRNVRHIEATSTGFRLITEDGEAIRSPRVIIASGIGSFAYRPPEFQGSPLELVTHTSEHRDLRTFAGKRVLVIGGGQSALESAALLHEGGAEVEVVARTGKIRWLQGIASIALHHRMGSFVRKLLYAPTDVGPAGISQIMARPDLLRQLPRAVQDKLSKRAIRPAGARWLVKRLQNVPLTLSRSVVSTVESGDRVTVKLDDGSERTVHHVLLGTGYRVDLSRYAFLSPKLLQSIHQLDGYPVLKQGLETSVPGLHILGAPAAWSFGALMRFVSGAGYASHALVHSIAKKSVANQHRVRA